MYTGSGMCNRQKERDGKSLSTQSHRWQPTGQDGHVKEEESTANILYNISSLLTTFTQNSYDSRSIMQKLSSKIYICCSHPPASLAHWLTCNFIL